MLVENEIWSPLIGYETLYEISNLGKVKSLRKGKLLKQGISRGYCQVSLTSQNGCLKTISVHKLVATQFIENPYLFKFINHKDGDKRNNATSNLEWCTSSYNQKHAYSTGLRRKMFGKLNGRYKTGKYISNVAL